MQIPNEYPSPVAAHFRYGTVRIPIVHEELGDVGEGRELRVVGAANHSKYPVSSDSVAAIAYPANLLSRQFHLSFEVGKDDEIVLRCVTLHEGDIGEARHSFTLVRGAAALEPRNTRAAPAGHER